MGRNPCYTSVIKGTAVPEPRLETRSDTFSVLGFVYSWCYVQLSNYCCTFFVASQNLSAAVVPSARVNLLPYAREAEGTTEWEHSSLSVLRGIYAGRGSRVFRRSKLKKPVGCLPPSSRRRILCLNVPFFRFSSDLSKQQYKIYLVRVDSIIRFLFAGRRWCCWQVYPSSVNGSTFFFFVVSV